jgi:hypothetical protein
MKFHENIAFIVKTNGLLAMTLIENVFCFTLIISFISSTTL